MKKSLSYIFLLFLIMASLSGCGVQLFISNDDTGVDDEMPVFDTNDVPAEIDFAKEANWMTMPENTDKYAADVFWVFPTVFHGNSGWIMDPADPAWQDEAKTTLVKQASVFEDSANIYAPYYRQMNMAALSLPQDQIDNLISYGEKDVWHAFEYYLENYNNGRPFILAGHSQGSDIIVNMMREKWGTTGAEDRMVAAYTIGWDIMPSDLTKNTNLKVCMSADETGCMIAYNSVKDGMQDQDPVITMGTYVVNPLNWTASTEDGEVVPASKNLGSVFFDENLNKISYENFSSAQIKNSGLACVVNDPSVMTTSPSFPEGVYHVDDYSLFYENLKENAKTRIAAFLNK